MEEAGIVLLKNHHVLPLNPQRVHSIALIGPQAARYENGSGTDDVQAARTDTPLAEIRRRAGPQVRVTYDDGTDTNHAAATAKAADVAIVFASDSEGEDREKFNASVDGSAARHTNQTALINAVAAANPRTVVVLETGDPVLTPWRNDVAGMLEAWYPGEAGGAALAHVLFGDADPGGRLPATFPNKESDLPTAGDPTDSNGPEVDYKEGVFVGYRWYDEQQIVPAYPFGFGLSYTTFRYSGLRVHANTVQVTVVNTGHRTGITVPQLYLGLPSPSASVPQPPRQLKGYRSLSLAPGQRATVAFQLDQRAFSYWNVSANGWRVAPGCYRVFVGRSSRDLPLHGVISRGGAHC
jgi:beta-glucosidase